MLRSLKQMFGDKLGATDGEIGHVKDFYFDNENWAIRYVVADTGTWLHERQVLLSPHSLAPLEDIGKVLRVNLTRKQIENSPSIETHKPVSRQYEEEYFRYYGWPFYWQGDGLWGMSGFPILEMPVKAPPEEASQPGAPKPEEADAHLLSAKVVLGYIVKASDGFSGHVSDFMIAPQSWAIEQIAIKTGHLLTAKEVAIPATMSNQISYEDSTVCVNMTTEAIEQSPGVHAKTSSHA